MRSALTDGRPTAVSPTAAHLRLPLLLGLVSLILTMCFVALASEVSEPSSPVGDRRVLDETQESITPWAVSAAKAIAVAGSETVVDTLAVVLAVGFLLRKRWGDAGLIALAIAGTYPLISLIKPHIARSRPFAFFRVPVPFTVDYSFPSGHTLDATCIALALCFVLWRSQEGHARKLLGTTLLTGWIAIVGVSRLVLGVHYPTDVLGSVLLGSAWLTALMALRLVTDRWAASHASSDQVGSPNAGKDRAIA